MFILIGKWLFLGKLCVLDVLSVFVNMESN